MINKSFESRQEMYSLGHYAACPCYIPLYFTPLLMEPHKILFHVTEDQVAQQMTYIDYQMYSKIEKRELYGQKWTKKDSEVFSQNVVSLMRRLQHISTWVAACILIQEEQSDRAEMICKFITLAQSLLNLNNYHSLVGVISGLSLAAISRLNQSFVHVPKKLQEQLKSITSLCTPEKSFKALRDQMSSSNVQMLPYMGIFLGDVILIDEGNPDTIEKEKRDESKKVRRLINFSKYQQLHQRIYSLLLYQQSEVLRNFKKIEPLYTLLHEIPGCLTGKELYQLSIAREPPNTDKSD